MNDILILNDQPSTNLSIRRWLASHWALTSDTYRKALGDVAFCLTDSRELGNVSWERIDAEALGAIRERLAQRYSPATVNRNLAAVRSLARTLTRDGLMSHDQLVGVLEVRGLPILRLRPGTLIEASEQQALIEACARTRAPRFHRALVSLLLAGGLRWSEAAYFLESDLSDYDRATGRLIVRFGKGRKMRTVYFTGTPARYLTDFIDHDDRGEWRYQKLQGQLARILHALRRHAGIERRITTHDYRRTFGSTQFANGTDISTVQELMGHASPAQTTAYDRRGDERKRAAALDPWR